MYRRGVASDQCITHAHRQAWLALASGILSGAVNWCLTGTAANLWGWAMSVQKYLNRRVMIVPVPRRSRRAICAGQELLSGAAHARVERQEIASRAVSVQKYFEEALFVIVPGPQKSRRARRALGCGNFE
jgi:hypothetical protein